MSGLLAFLQQPVHHSWEEVKSPFGPQFWPGKPLKTAKNRIYRLWFTGHWTSTARPDIPDVAVTAIFPVISTALPHIPFVGALGGGGRRAPFLEKNSTLQFSPTVAPILHETSSPRYQMKGLVTSYRTVTGFGWVGAAAAEICGFSGLLSFSGLLMARRLVVFL